MCEQVEQTQITAAHLLGAAKPLFGTGDLLSLHVGPHCPPALPASGAQGGLGQQ